MSSNWPKSGPNNADPFLMSGIPFVTSSSPTGIPARDTEDRTNPPGGGNDISPVKISFPFVTKWVTIRNIGKNNLRIGFSQEGLLSKNDFYNLSDTNSLDGDKKTHNTLNCFILRATGSDHSTNGFYHPTLHKLPPTTAIDDSVTFNIRCVDMFVVSDTARSNPASSHATGISVIAGLTTIHRSQFPSLTGSINCELAFEGV